MPRACAFGLLLLVFITNPVQVRAVTLTPGDILIVDVGTSVSIPARVLKIDPVNGTQSEISAGGLLDVPVGIALGNHDQIFVLNQRGGGATDDVWIVRIDPTTGGQVAVTTGGVFRRGTGLAMTPLGMLIAADTGIAGLVRVDPTTGIQTVVTSGGFLDDPFGVAIDAEGNYLVADTTTRNLVRVDKGTGSQQVISTGGLFVRLFGVAVGPTGSIFVSDLASPVDGDSRIVEVDPGTGVQTLVAQPGNYTAALIVLDAHGNVIAPNQHAQLNPRLANVLQIAPTGEVTVLSESGLLFDPAGVAVVPPSTQAEIDVTPLRYDFGQVDLGTSSTQIVTISNVGNAPLVVTDVALLEELGFGFELADDLVFPTEIEPGGTVDLDVVFTPTDAGAASATLRVTSNDPGAPVVEVALAAFGVPYDDQVMALLSLFDDLVDSGDLVGKGPGRSGSGRLNALRNMIEASGDMIERGWTAQACEQLEDARLRTDGLFPPPDFASGPAASELEAEIGQVQSNLGCQGLLSITRCGLGAELAFLLPPLLLLRQRRRAARPFPHIQRG